MEMPGRLLRLTVGVMVPEGTSGEQRRAIRELVEVTVGLEPSRGDQIAVYAVSEIEHTAGESVFVPADPAPLRTAADTSMAVAEAPEAALVDWRNLPKTTVLIAGAAVALLILAMLFTLLRRPVSVPPVAGELSPVEREQLLSDIRLWLEQDEPPVIADIGPGGRV